MRLILFDIDGTLVRTYGVGRRALMKAVEELHGGAAGAEKISYKGKTDPEILAETGQVVIGRNFLPNESAQLLERYLNYFHEELAASSGFQVLPGTAETIKELASNPKFKLGVETGNIETAAWAKLSRANIRAHFCCGGFGSDSSNRSDIVRIAIDRARRQVNEDFEKIFVIGDAPQDMHAARSCGAVPVGILHGSDMRTELSSAGAHVVLEDFGLLTEIVDS